MRIIPPTEGSSGTQGRSYPRPRSDREAAIEKRITGYIHLTCDHVTTWQADEFYRLRSSPKDKHYCENCGRWVRPKPKVKAPVQDVPLF